MKKKKKSFFLRLAVFSFAVYIFVLFVQLQLQIGSRNQELADIQQSIQEQTDYNAEMERLLSEGGETDYIERLAREKLGYAYPNEHIYIDRSKE